YRVELPLERSFIEAQAPSDELPVTIVDIHLRLAAANIRPLQSPGEGGIIDRVQPIEIRLHYSATPLFHAPRSRPLVVNPNLRRRPGHVVSTAPRLHQAISDV